MALDEVPAGDPAANAHNANPGPGAGPVPGDQPGADLAAEPIETSTDFTTPLLWLVIALAMYAYNQGVNRYNWKSKLFPKRESSSSSQNFHQQAPSADINRRQAYLDKLQAGIDATAAERKAEREQKEQTKAKQVAIDKINKQQAVIDGTHYSGMANSLDDEEQKRREEIEAILKRKREAKKAEVAGASSSSRRTLRDDDFNPLGSNTTGEETCRYRPGQSGGSRRSA